MNIFGRKDKGRSSKRPTRFAGTWYEGNSKALDDELCGYLNAAENVLEGNPATADCDGSKRPLYAIIAPHAGYIYSGATAGVAYSFAKRFKPKRVFLMGPSHYVGFQGVVLTPDESFETPLGDLPLDRTTVEALLQYPMFDESREVHQKEHSLELQLAFIRKAFGEVPIVPLIVGLLNDPADVRLVGQIIRRYIHEDDLVVVSSDFTHYGPRYDYVPFPSSAAPEKVKELDLEAFSCLEHADLPGFLEFHDRTRCTICGFYPTAVLLSMLPPGAKAELLQYRTSMDVSSDEKENSVSYLAIAFTGTDGAASWEADKGLSKDDLLNEAEKSDLLFVARQALDLFVREKKVLRAEDAGVEITPAMRQPLGAFVTLFKHGNPKPRKTGSAGGGSERIRADGTPEDRDLRGCIGYIWPIKPLIEAVIDNAIGSCSKDPRFIEVKESELSDIDIEVSVLTPLTRAQSEEEIEIGKHGIVMYLRGRQSVFLPHVAPEFGWTLEETLSQLARKAGFGSQDWRNSAHYDIFESIMFEEERH